MRHARRRQAVLRACAGGAMAGVLLLAAGSGAASLVVRNARLIDGTGVPPREGVSIVIRDGRITDVGTDIDANDVPALDVAGATVIPGLIDGHVHLMEVPGGNLRGEPPPEQVRLRHEQLRSYLACGVTTVLDAADRVGVVRELRAWSAGGHPAPTFLTLGPPIAPRAGYMSLLSPDLIVSSIDDLDRVFDAIASVDGIGAKVPIERGFGPRPIFRVHAPEVREAIVRKAAARKLPIYVHASDETEQSIALDMGAHALLHLNFGGVDPSPAFVERVARLRPYVVTTFSILDAEMIRWHPERLDDPLVQVAVPVEELRSARAPEMWTAADRAELSSVYPWVPSVVVRLLAEPPREEQLARTLGVNLRAAKRLYDAGVPLVIGSDAGNSSVLSQFHGTSTFRELELLADAGVPLPDVLAAATRASARMLGIEADAGTVEPGKRGDLVVLRDDPLRDVHAFRTVRWTVRAGVAHTPREWMSPEAIP